MRSNALASVLVLSALAPASPAVASLSDFRLPGERPQPEQPPPDLQGPVAPDVPASRRRPATPAPSPTANNSEPPARQADAPPVEIPSGLQATPGAPSSPREAAAPTPGPAPAVATSDATGPAQPSAAQPADAASPGAPAVPRPGREPNAVQAPLAGREWPWWWLGALALPFAALGTAGWVVRRRARDRAEPAAAPPVERPRPAPAPASPPPQPGEPLQVSLEPLRLALTLMNATLAYRLELTNRGTSALSGVAIGADMISAHASLSREEQLSGPRSGHGGDSPPQRIERLEPGERRVVEGEFRLPFPQIVPIRQGDAALLLPLARFRVEADGAAPVVRTFVVGQPGAGQRLRPFRLDQGPRIYPHLAHHAFA